MANTAGTSKSKPDNLEDKQLERDEERREAERTRQQDLNQGMDTGTHDTVRHGVNWGSADSGRTVVSKKPKPSEAPSKRKSSDDNPERGQ